MKKSFIKGTLNCEVILDALKWKRDGEEMC